MLTFWGRRWGLAGVALLVLNPLVIYYGPLAGHDMPCAALLTTAAALFVTLGEAKPDWARPLVGLVLALTIAMRPNLALAVPVAFLAEMCRRRRGGVSWRAAFPSPRFSMWIGVVPLTLALFIIVALLGWKERSLLVGAKVFMNFVRAQAGIGPYPGTDPWYEYLVTLPLAATLPVAVAAVVGMLTVVRGGRWPEGFLLLLFLSVFVFHGFYYPHHEIRYLLSVFALIPNYTVRGQNRAKIERATLKTAPKRPNYVVRKITILHLE